MTKEQAEAKATALTTNGVPTLVRKASRLGGYQTATIENVRAHIRAYRKTDKYRAAHGRYEDSVAGVRTRRRYEDSVAGVRTRRRYGDSVAGTRRSLRARAKERGTR